MDKEFDSELLKLLSKENIRKSVITIAEIKETNKSSPKFLHPKCWIKGKKIEVRNVTVEI